MSMQPPRPAENLEPLNFGPDLEPIKEEMTPRESLDVNSVGDRSAPREVSWTALNLAYSLHYLLTACHHGWHQESEAGGQRGGKGQGTGGAVEIGVWGLWAKCRPGLELPGVRVEPQTPVHSTDAHFRVKIGFKFRPLGKISNISTSQSFECAGSFHDYYLQIIGITS